jgi:hypothetical protein
MLVNGNSFDLKIGTRINLCNLWITPTNNRLPIGGITKVPACEMQGVTYRFTYDLYEDGTYVGCGPATTMREALAEIVAAYERYERNR